MKYARGRLKANTGRALQLLRLDAAKNAARLWRFQSTRLTRIAIRQQQSKARNEHDNV